MKKIKLDENFPPGFLPIFQNELIDASSVYLQNISGADDNLVYKVCREEDRTLVTFDFANILRYPADDTAGIIVCRLRKKINLDYLRELSNMLVKVISEHELSGKLFIVEDNKVRIRNPDEGNRPS
jgi:predicted nuclease of predicted toxin-antitoxin system